ncbi:hypothetical protein QJS04_geneDACA015022 [Acorus gramineus]|uniref:Ribosomal biogenesis protein LAS1L n=1 Tax=Acorus gramineus TaxID=55184 RepID=A0AAV9BYN0_ACOGR|nr:hypothetical protein QJS04_geneDACA015022 [Acorus gramineus]
MEAKEVSSGYKHVPWSSWDQWSSVADSLFSSSPDSIKSALARIVAWRSRGCLPMAIEVTASFIEIQQKDPFFHSHKRTGRSISQLAEDVGMPRMLVDIRHESSHRNLPSLPIVRLGSMKALDWLKSHYWEPQKKAIPNVRDEMKSRMHELIQCIKSKRISRLSPAQSKGILDKKQVSKIVKAIVRLYSAYPTEVVTVLLEFFQLHASESLSNADVECYEAEIRWIEQLSSLVLWFLVKLKDLKNLGQLHSADENPISSAEKDTVPRVTLKELLRKCLLLSASGNKHIFECALFIAELTSDNSLIDRLKKLPFLKSQIRENMPEDWSVVKSWSPCPIGMLPCPFSSAPILPVLDSIDGGCKIQEAMKGGSNGKRGAEWEDEVMENVSAMKKMKGMVLECDGSDGEVSVCASSREGCLLIGGVWRKVGEEELHDIESGIKVLVG